MIKFKILEYKLNNKEIERAELFKNDDIICWFVKLKLPIAQRGVDVFFDTATEKNDITNSQKSFLEWVVNHFDLVQNSIPTVLPDNLRKQYDGSYSIVAGFIIKALTIPDIDNGYHKWDITFKIKNEKGVYLVVYFDLQQPTSAYIQKDEAKWWVKLLARIFGY